MTDYPPFGPTAPVATLPQAERKRTGHILADCPARDLEPTRKGTKVVPCGPCLARWTEHSAEAGRQQRAFDAAWYAANAATPLRVTDEDGASHVIPPSVRAAQANEADIWDAVASNHVATGDYPGRRNEPRVDRFEAGTVGAVRAGLGRERPNKFGGKCVTCAQWVEANAGLLVKDSAGKWGAKHPAACPEPKAKGPAAEQAATPGMYWDRDHQPVRVQVSRTSGKPYAQRPNADGSGLTYLGGGRHLEGLTPMTLDEAVAWGRQTSACCVCGTVLEDPNSVAAGIGPICARKF